MSGSEEICTTARLKVIRLATTWNTPMFKSPPLPKWKPIGSSRSKPGENRAKKTNKKNTRITNTTEIPIDLYVPHQMEPSRHKKTARNTQNTEEDKISNNKFDTRRTRQQERLG